MKKTDRKLVVIHGGQTGVDRGAHKAAIEVGFTVTGYMPSDGKDEDGPIPGKVASHLRRCNQGGYVARTRANLLIADALLTVVEDRIDPYATPGTKLTLQIARELRLPRLLVDETFAVQDAANWLWSLGAPGQPGEGVEVRESHRLMVAGPRASKWARGELVAAAFVRAMARLPVCALEGHDWIDDECSRCHGRRPRRARDVG